jgi:hypothetical protein
MAMPVAGAHIDPNAGEEPAPSNQGSWGCIGKVKNRVVLYCSVPLTTLPMQASMPQTQGNQPTWDTPMSFFLTPTLHFFKLW